MNEFEIVPAGEQAAVRETKGEHGRAPSPISLALAAGEMVFIPKVANNSFGLYAKRSYLARRGYRLYSHRGERGGVRGTFIWAEPPETVTP